MSKRSIRKIRHLTSNRLNTDTKYNHKEAFALMMYGCEKCGHVETLWNSRDGVTPFTIKCNHNGCDGFKRHIYWHMDICVPNHKPSTGLRCFADQTKEEFEKIMREKLISLNGTEHEIPKNEFEDYLQECIAGFEEGQPTIIIAQ